ncbi:hypothetical protein H7097_04040 [Aeromicrobium sp.]|nr:hypothetical protein [Candidatus Saccharibacteria bacterium]
MTESFQSSRGRELAQQVAEQLRRANPIQESVEVTVPAFDPTTPDEQQVYVTNPGHNPMVEN